jgi:hypothetical protein
MSTGRFQRERSRLKATQLAITGVLALGVAFGGLAVPLVSTAHASVEASGDGATHGVSAAASDGISLIDSRLDEVALNPQPLPPRSANYLFRIVRGPAERLAEVGLNPQPLPPRILR